MRKFLIGLSGIYLILVGIIMLALSILSFFLPPQASNSQLLKSYVLMGGITLIVAGLLPIVTGLGIILKKNWARISILLISGFAVLMGLFSSIALFIIPLPQNDLVTKLIPLVFFVIFLVAVPIAFIIFFNSKSVKALFIPAGGEEKRSKRPFGITLIAVLSLLTGLIVLPYIFFPFFPNKMPLGPIMLSGKALKIYFLIMNFIQIYIGVGILKLRKFAWKTAIFFHLINILIVVVNVFTMTEENLLQMNPALIKGNFSMTLADFRIFSLIGLVTPVVILIYLFLKRNLFLKTIQI